MALEPFIKKQEGMSVQYDGTNQIEIIDLLVGVEYDAGMPFTYDGTDGDTLLFLGYSVYSVEVDTWLMFDSNGVNFTGFMPTFYYDLYFQSGEYGVAE